MEKMEHLVNYSTAHTESLPPNCHTARVRLSHQNVPIVGQQGIDERNKPRSHKLLLLLLL